MPAGSRNGSSLLLRGVVSPLQIELLQKGEKCAEEALDALFRAGRMKQVIALEHRALHIVDEICLCLADAFGRVGRKEDAAKTNEKLTSMLCRSGVAEAVLKNFESAAAKQQQRDGKFLPTSSYIESHVQNGPTVSR